MPNQTELIAELVAFHQIIMILALRQSDDHRSYRGVSTKEIFQLEKKLDYKFLELPEDLKERILEVRKKKYDIT